MEIGEILWKTISISFSLNLVFITNRWTDERDYQNWMQNDIKEPRRFSFNYQLTSKFQQQFQMKCWYLSPDCIYRMWCTYIYVSICMQQIHQTFYNSLETKHNLQTMHLLSRNIIYLWGNGRIIRNHHLPCTKPNHCLILMGKVW